MKKLLFLLILIPFLSYSQKTVDVAEGTAKINSERYAGYKTKITGDIKDLEDFLKKDLKSKGKTRERSSYFSVTEMTLGGKFYQDRMFYAELNRGDGVHSFFFGADTTALSSYDVQLLNSALKNYTYDFVIRFYKWEVQQELDESLKAEAFIVKQQGKFAKETEDLASKLSSNEKELIRLQKAIEDNKAEHIELLQKIEENKTNKITAAADLVKIREVIDLQKKKQTAIK